MPTVKISPRGRMADSANKKSTNSEFDVGPNAKNHPPVVFQERDLGKTAIARGLSSWATGYRS